ncbi:MAG: hypothetical protein ACREEW_14310 [Caulobacteraceae bacterium]
MPPPRLSPPRIYLIGGTSHAGKSSLAARLAVLAGGTALSTDSLARHPGRPWRPGLAPPPPHVIEHYRDLAPEALIASVLEHYERLWPRVRLIVERHLADPVAAPLVIEGSALLPWRVAELDLKAVSAAWLATDAALVVARMRRESCYQARDEPARALIDAFAERARLFNDIVEESVRRLGLTLVGADNALDVLAERLL